MSTFTKGWTSGNGGSLFTRGWTSVEVVVVSPPVVSPGGRGYLVDHREVDRFFDEMDKRDEEMLMLSIALIDVVEVL